MDPATYQQEKSEKRRQRRGLAHKTPVKPIHCRKQIADTDDTIELEHSLRGKGRLLLSDSGFQCYRGGLNLMDVTTNFFVVLVGSRPMLPLPDV